MSLSNKQVCELVGWLALEKNTTNGSPDLSNEYMKGKNDMIDTTIRRISYLSDCADTGVHGIAKLKEYFEDFYKQSTILIERREEEATKSSIMDSLNRLKSDFEYLITSTCIAIPIKIEEFINSMARLYRHIRKEEIEIAYMDLIYSKVISGLGTILDQIQ